MKKSKVLILAWGVFPGSGGSTIILNNIASKFDASEMVIAGQIPKKMPEEKWKSFSSIPLYYLNPFPFNQRRPERIIKWLTTYYVCNQVEYIIKKENITSILSIFPDEYFSYIGYRVSKKLKLPFYLWMHNSYLENRTGILKTIAQYLQPKLFSHAKKVFVMSEGLKAEMNKAYPENTFITLPHGFDLTLPSNINHKRKDRISFAYTGALNESCLDASIRMLKVLLENPLYDIHIFSGNPRTFEEYGITGEQVKFYGFLPYDEFMKMLCEFDILLLPHGLDGLRSDFEYKTIFPTRTIPLLFSGRPILAHSPKESFLTDFLQKSDCAYIVTEKNKEQIQKGINTLLANEAYVTRITTNAKSIARQFELSTVVAKLKSEIEN